MTTAPTALTDTATTGGRGALLTGLAAAAGLLGAFAMAGFALFAWAFTGGVPTGLGALWLASWAAVSVAVLAGVVLLLRGRSWRVLALAAVAMVAVSAFQGDSGSEFELSFAAFFAACPLLAALLTLLPPVRDRVAARRAVA